MPEAGSNIVTIQIQDYDKPVIYRNLILNQAVCNHHEFSFTWNAGSFKSDINFQLDVIKTYMGASVSITLGENEFVGVITEIAVDDRSSDAQSFVIKGQSNTILIDDIPKSSSYYKKSLSDIINKALENLADNVMSKSIAPVNTTPLHYTTQYNETDFQFLSRLAVRYGEWFFYDGTKLVFGKPGDSGATLKAGVDLDRIIIQANAQPNKYNYKSYDAHKGEPIEKNLANLGNEIKNDFSNSVTKKSLETFKTSYGQYMHTFNVVNKDQIEALTKLEEYSLNAKMLTVKGESKNPALKAGCKFNIENQGGTYDYVAIKITHISNLIGHYQNTFTAVPATVKVPPYTNPHVIRKADTQTAMVKENHDSDGIGRVKVQFHWQSGSDMTPWLRVSTPHAGAGKGMHFIPEKGEEVIVDFEGGDADKPFILGSMYNGKAKSGHGDGDNNTKGLQSRSGSKMMLDDKEGSVFLADKTGADTLMIDGKGNINIDCTETFVITCGESSISLKKDGTIDIIGKNITINGADTIGNESKKISISGSEEVVMGSGGATLTLKSGGGEATLDGTKTTVSAATEVTVNGGATTTVSAGGKVAIQGALVALN